MTDREPSTRKPPKVGKPAIVEGGDYGRGQLDVPKQHKNKHWNELFPDGRIAMMILGRAGSGKSFLLRQLIPCFGNISQIVVCTKIPNNPMYRILKKWCSETTWHSTIVPGDVAQPDEEEYVGRGEEEEDGPSSAPVISPVYIPTTGTQSSAQALGLMPTEAKPISTGGKKGKKSLPADHPIEYYEAHDPQTGMEALNTALANKTPAGGWSIAIFDDFDGGTTVKTNPYVTVQQQVYQKMRNMNFHVISISQSAYNIVNTARGNVNMFYFFDTIDKMPVKGARDAYHAITGRDPTEMMALLREVHVVPHGYIMFADYGDGSRVFKNLPGKTKGIEEVHFQEELTSEDVKNDPQLIAITEKIRKFTAAGAKREVMEPIYEELELRIANIAKEYDADVNQVRFMMMKEHSV